MAISHAKRNVYPLCWIFKNNFSECTSSDGKCRPFTLIFCIDYVMHAIVHHSSQEMAMYIHKERIHGNYSEFEPFCKLWASAHTNLEKIPGHLHWATFCLFLIIFK